MSVERDRMDALRMHEAAKGLAFAHKALNEIDLRRYRRYPELVQRIQAARKAADPSLLAEFERIRAARRAP